jgi:hypothetical protein
VAELTAKKISSSSLRDEKAAILNRGFSLLDLDDMKNVECLTEK